MLYKIGSSNACARYHATCSIIADLYIPPFRPELIALRVFELQARLGLQSSHFGATDFSWKARLAHCTRFHAHSIHLEHRHDSKIFYEHVMLTHSWLWLVQERTCELYSISCTFCAVRASIDGWRNNSAKCLN